MCTNIEWISVSEYRGRQLVRHRVRANKSRHRLFTSGIAALQRHARIAGFAIWREGSVLF